MFHFCNLTLMDKGSLKSKPASGWKKEALVNKHVFHSSSPYTILFVPDAKI